MRLLIDTWPNGSIRVRDADTLRQLEGVFRVEMRASGRDPKPEVVIFLDARACRVNVEAAQVVIDQRPAPHPPIDEE
jgi:hypothetical protein